MVNKKKARPGVIDLETGKPLDEVETEETPVLNQPEGDIVAETVTEAPAGPVVEAGTPCGISITTADTMPMEERLKARIAKSEAGTPTLIQFEQRSGRPCSVLVELDIRTVREAWTEWCDENGKSNPEGFVMALHDAMDAFPVRIMRPCVAYNLN